MSLEEYSADLYKRKATERFLQELVEAAVDINTHILVESGDLVPDYYFESFIKLGEAKSFLQTLLKNWLHRPG